MLLTVALLLLWVPCPGSSVRVSELLDSFLRDEEALVNRIAVEAEEAHRNREQHVKNCSCTVHTCAAVPNIPLQCTQSLGTPKSCGGSCGSMLNYDSSAVSLAPGSNPTKLSSDVKETLCTYKALDAEFKDLSPHIRTWTYVGTMDGTMRTHPIQLSDIGLEDGDELTNNCPKFDPRARPWYIAASTGPKDVVILVEASRVIPVHDQGWKLVREKIQFLMDTFTFSDYVNIVAVGTDARPLWKGTPLLRGSSENLGALRTELAGVERKGAADTNRGFQTAFQLFQDAHKSHENSSGCSRIIIFLSQGLDCIKFDGVPCSLPATGGTEILLHNIEEMQKNMEESVGSRALIFTFSVGDQAHDSLPRQIACRNDGSWSSLGEKDDPIVKLQSYSRFLAAAYRVRKPVWTDPYEDAFGLGMITSVTKPFYSSGGANGTGGVLLVWWVMMYF